VFSKNIQYTLEYDFAASSLRSTYLQLVHCDALKFKVGNFKVPFDLEALVSGSEQQFVDRSIVYTYFGIPDQREVGATLTGEVADKLIEYEVGAFNGEGNNKINANQSVRWSGRLNFRVAGTKGYEYADTKNSSDPQVMFGVSGMFNNTPD